MVKICHLVSVQKSIPERDVYKTVKKVIELICDLTREAAGNITDDQEFDLEVSQDLAEFLLSGKSGASLMYKNAFEYIRTNFRNVNLLVRPRGTEPSCVNNIAFARCYV